MGFIGVVITIAVVAVISIVGTLFAVKRNPKLMSVIGAYDQMIKKIKEIK